MKNILCVLALIMFAFVIGFDTTAYGQRLPEWVERDIREEKRQQQEQQKQQRQEQLPTWVQRDIQEEKRQAEQEKRMSTEQLRELQRERQERTAQIQRELREQRERPLPTWVQRDIQEEERQKRVQQQSNQSNQSPTSSEEWNRRSNPIIDGREYSVRERYGNHGVFGFFSPPSNQGHSYDLYESIGRRNLTAKQAFEYLFNDLNAPFPIRAVGTDGQEIVKGNKFVLSVGGYFANTVEVIDVTETSFTLKVVQGEHIFQGTVTHQVVKDSNGELWLRHTGKGINGENPYIQTVNYAVADYLWNRMAYISNQMLNSIP